MSALSEYGPLQDVAVSHPRVAFGDAARIARQWRDLGFTAAPDFGGAIEEFDAFMELLTQAGARLHTIPAAADITLDALYARDASISTPEGMVACAMGKAQRRGESAVQVAAFREWQIPIAGTIDPPGCIEGGDLIWLDDRTLAVGRGYRTNENGIRQLRALVSEDVELVVVPLPHWKGPDDVFHLMSMISPIDRDLAVVYAPLLPVPFREWLADRGVAFVDVPGEEFESMGANVLAVGPRHCVMLEGNPVTRARLEAAGARVDVYRGREISLKGGGGPTCLTRPLRRL
jgi:N-dimethylarginine dimethylaminohydrolase